MFRGIWKKTSPSSMVMVVAATASGLTLVRRNKVTFYILAMFKFVAFMQF